VAVPQGRHTVELSYFPATLVPALACVLAVLGAVGGWELVRRRRRPRTRPGAFTLGN
jgi:hypothetical protein